MIWPSQTVIRTSQILLCMVLPSVLSCSNKSTKFYFSTFTANLGPLRDNMMLFEEDFCVEPCNFPLRQSGPPPGCLLLLWFTLTQLFVSSLFLLYFFCKSSACIFLFNVTLETETVEPKPLDFVKYLYIFRILIIWSPKAS